MARRWIKPAASASAEVGAAALGTLLGFPHELVAAGSLAVAGMMGALPSRSREDVIRDEPNRANRARAYEAFGEAVAQSSLAGRMIVTTAPRLVDIRLQSAVARAQKRFEEQTCLATAALATVLLYASDETRGAARDLLIALTTGLSDVGRHKPGTPDAAQALEQAMTQFGSAFGLWQKAALADLSSGAAGRAARRLTRRSP